MTLNICTLVLSVEGYYVHATDLVIGQFIEAKVHFIEKFGSIRRRKEFLPDLEIDERNVGDHLRCVNSVHCETL